MMELLDLFSTFAYLAFISLGSALAIIPEMERVVSLHGWMNHEEFVQAFALSQLAPGPNLLHIFLIGYRVAGLPGAISAGLGMFGPTSLLIVGLAIFTNSVVRSAWMKRLHGVISPITLGLMAATAWSLSYQNLSDSAWIGISTVSFLLSIQQRLSSAWVILGAAFFGVLKGCWLG
jgi:chromate transporter